MSTVLALFKDQGEAEAAVEALRSAHFESARLGVVHAGDANVPRYGQNALVGVVGGTIGCGLVGVMIGIVAAGLAPGLVAWLPGGWFVPFIVGLGGAATGAVAGLLMSQSVSRQHTLYYEDEVAAGRTLVSVYSEPDKVEEARRILLEEGAFEAAPIDAPMRKAS
jgi:hypothetical protein